MNAPAELAAYRMLATHCCVCHLPLRDPVSVELGIGPICRATHGYDDRIEVVDPEVRLEARGLIFKLALAFETSTPASILVATDRLRELGFNRLADVIAKNNAKVVVTVIDLDGAEGRLCKVPANSYARAALEWCGAVARLSANRRNRAGAAVLEGHAFPATMSNEVHNRVLRLHFRGLLGFGPRGAFVI